MVAFGDFAALCRNTPSYPWCNLFYKQLQKKAPDVLTALSLPANGAPVGVNQVCGIARLGTTGTTGDPVSKSLGNIANIIACGLSILIVSALIMLTSRRKAAVGRVELRVFLILYLFTLPLQLVTTGAFLVQGSMPLVIITAIHAGAVASLFWSLFANAVVATQVVEDGTLSSLVPFHIFNVAFFGATTYIALDVALAFTNVFQSTPPQAMNSIALFVLTSVWPAAASLLYLLLMAYVVLVVLKERRPMLYYIIAAFLFVLAQLAFFLLGKIICNGVQNKIDGSFIATVLETAAVSVLYMAWRSITEESWEEDVYYRS